jgi:hypothetical protein
MKAAVRTSPIAFGREGTPEEYIGEFPDSTIPGKETACDLALRASRLGGESPATYRDRRALSVLRAA